MNKIHFKKSNGKCAICGETDYATLQVHRINPGYNGGKYKFGNCTTICGNCHLKVHASEIIIDRYYLCSDGTEKLRIVKDGIEKFI